MYENVIWREDKEWEGISLKLIPGCTYKESDEHFSYPERLAVLVEKEF